MKNLQVRPLVAHILLFIVNLIYGANFSIAKSIMPSQIGPYGFIFCRVTISAILYGILYCIWIREKIRQEDWWRVIACGFFGIALNQLMFFRGISLTSSIHGSLLMILTPMITFVLYSIIEKKIWRKEMILGIILGTCGASTLIISSMRVHGEASWEGDLFVIINAISYSIYLILVQKLMSRYHPITVIYYCFVCGWIWVAVAGYNQALEGNWSMIMRFYIPAFLFVVIGATFIVYLFNVIAMKSLSPPTVSSYIYLQPFFAILISVKWAGEKLTIYSIIGGIFIIFGLWLFNYKSQ